MKKLKSIPPSFAELHIIGAELDIVIELFILFMLHLLHLAPLEFQHSLLPYNTLQQACSYQIKAHHTATKQSSGYYIAGTLCKNNLSLILKSGNLLAGYNTGTRYQK